MLRDYTRVASFDFVRLYFYVSRAVKDRVLRRVAAARRAIVEKFLSRVEYCTKITRICSEKRIKIEKSDVISVCVVFCGSFCEI